MACYISSRKKRTTTTDPAFVVVLYFLKATLRFALSQFLAAKITFLGVLPQIGLLLG
jgi:hypothetical protein